MEISKTTTAIFYVSRFFGLAPYQIIRNAKGHIIDYSKGNTWYIYTILVIFAAGKVSIPRTKAVIFFLF